MPVRSWVSQVEAQVSIELSELTHRAAPHEFLALGGLFVGLFPEAELVQELESNGVKELTQILSAGGSCKQLLHGVELSLRPDENWLAH